MSIRAWAILGLAAAAMATPTPDSRADSVGVASPQGGAVLLPSRKTEEGQTVIFDGYTWKRRELAKRLPLDEAWPSDSAIEAQFERFGLNSPSIGDSIPVPSRIMTDVYLVNSEPNLTYLIDAGQGNLVIIDPGLESNAEAILSRIKAIGFSPGDIKWVINTHAHFDHSMADAYFQKLGAKILIGRADVAAVEKGTDITANFALPGGVERYPTALVDWPVDDGERLVLGNKTFLAIHTPGHTEGATCFMLSVEGKTLLFGGDTVLFDYRLGYQGLPSSDDVAYLASLKKLTKLGEQHRWDVLLPGHGTITLDRAYLDLLKGLRQVELDVTNGDPVDSLPFATDAYREIMFGRP